jgi:hypothetical protein
VRGWSVFFALLLAIGLALLAVGGPGGPGSEGISRWDDASGETSLRKEGPTASAPVLEGRAAPSPAPPLLLPLDVPAPLRTATGAVEEEVARGLLAGLVAAADGRPLEGAVVSARLHRGAAANLEPVSTDRAGRFAFEAVPLASSFYLDVEPADAVAEAGVAYAERVVGPVSVADVPVAIVLEVEALIEGRVLDEDGDPLPVRAVKIVARRVGADPGEAWQAASQPEGTFTLGPLPAGPYVVWATSDSDLLAPPPLLSVTAPASDVRIVMADAGAVEGAVLGAHVAGFEVGWSMRLGEGVTVGRSVRVGEDGRFRVGGVGPGPVLLWARGGGRVAVQQGVLAGEGYELRPDRGFSIEGSVRFVDLDASEGLPALVLLLEEEASGYQVRCSFSDGTFRLDSLPPGVYRPQLAGGGWEVARAARIRAGAQGVELSVSRRGQP